MEIVALKRLYIVLTFAAVACSGDGSPTDPVVPGALRFAEISAGYYHTCGLSTDERVYCWGNNGFGTLGDGTRTVRTKPTRIFGTSTYTALDAGAGHNCALKAGGIAECWGQNDEGQAGDGTFTARDRPVAVSGGHVFTQISAGHAHSCGLIADGSAYCWGDNSRGQLGAGPEAVSKSATPLRVQASFAFTRVIAGYYQSCGLTANGEAYCWGLNSGGQNGDGTTVDSPLPVRARSPLTFTALAPGDRFVCGVSSGSTQCWGENRHGESRNSETVSFVTAASGESTVPGADSYACGIRTDGIGVCWGGTVRGWPLAGLRPMDVNLKLKSITAGSQHVCAITQAGFAYCIGANYDGQLGDGTHTDRADMTPVISP
jgi:alpha-tubulin suppressor-like RCC1 family protein